MAPRAGKSASLATVPAQCKTPVHARHESSAQPRRRHGRDATIAARIRGRPRYRGGLFRKVTASLPLREPGHPMLRLSSVRYRPLMWCLTVFLVVSTLTRAVLLAAAGTGVPMNPLYWLDLFGIGLGFDLLTFVYFAWPLVLLLWLL